MSPDDRELEEYLAGGSRLSRDYGTLGQDEPPPALDLQIRATAAAAVQPRKARRATLWWLRPVALAATVVLAVSVMLRLNIRPPAGLQAPDKAGPPVVTVDLGRGALERPADVAQPPARQAFNAPAPKIEPPVEETLTVTTAKRTESLNEVPLAVTALDATPAAAPPVSAEGEQASLERTLSPDTVARALAAIHARIDAGDKGWSGSQRIGALRSSDREVSPVDARLREILALEGAGKADEIPAALVQFARDFPGDSLSSLLAVGPH